MSRKTHHFDVDDAKTYGLEEAIFIDHLAHWIRGNRYRGVNLREGRTWTYNSVRAYLLHFPYWSQDTIRRVITSLIEKNVIMRGEFNENPYDRTKWYAFVDEARFVPSEVGGMTEEQNPHIDLAKTPNVDLGKSPNAHIRTTSNQVLTKGIEDSPKVERAKELIAHLNSEMGRTGPAEFRLSPSRLKAISARLDEVSGDMEGTKKALSRKVAEWKGRPDMAQFLTPDTLFRPSKFLGYYETRDMPVATMPAIPPWKEKQQIEARIEVHPANPEWIRYDKNKVTDILRADLKRLRMRLEELKDV